MPGNMVDREGGGGGGAGGVHALIQDSGSAAQGVEIGVQKTLPGRWLPRSATPITTKPISTSKER